MDDYYINQKLEDIMTANKAFGLLEEKRKLIKLVLENVWLAGKVEAIRETKEEITRQIELLKN